MERNILMESKRKQKNLRKVPEEITQLHVQLEKKQLEKAVVQDWNLWRLQMPKYWN
jgi:hypothetical protein